MAKRTGWFSEKYLHNLTYQYILRYCHERDPCQKSWFDLATITEIAQLPKRYEIAYIDRCIGIMPRVQAGGTKPFTYTLRDRNIEIIGRALQEMREEDQHKNDWRFKILLDWGTKYELLKGKKKGATEWKNFFRTYSLSANTYRKLIDDLRQKAAARDLL